MVLQKCSTRGEKLHPVIVNSYLEEKKKTSTEKDPVIELLESVHYCLNEIPNKRLHQEKYLNTYALAAAVGDMLNKLKNK